MLGKKPSQEDITPEEAEKAKKQQQLNALVFAAVFLLSILLPRAYKAFAPFLFVIPIIFSVINKIRKTGEDPANPPKTQYHSPSAGDSIPSIDPYSYKPKDPKDPRRYKPIG